MSNICKKILRIILRVFLALCATVAILLLSLPLIVDSDWFKDQVGTRLTDSLGRKVVFGGNIDLKLGRTVGLTVKDVVLENPKEIPERQMLSVGTLHISAPIVAGITERYRIQEIVLSDVSALVAKDSRGVLNWQFSKGPSQSAQKESDPIHLPIVEKIKLKNIALSIKVGEQPRQLQFNSLLATSVDLEDLSSVTSSFSIDGIPLKLSGGVGSLQDFLAGADLEVEVDLQHKDSRVEAKGKLQSDGGLKLALKLSGADLSDLSSVLDIELPSLRDYSFFGNLNYKRGEKGSLSLANSSLKVGNSDLNGRLDIELVPLSIKASLKSEALNISDFAKNEVGDKENDIETSEKVEETSGKNEIPFKLLETFGAQVDLQLKQLKAGPKWEFGNTVLSLEVQGGKLRVPAFSTTTLGGSLAGVLSASPQEMQIELSAKEISIGSINKVIQGAFDAHLHARSAGKTWREALEKLQGQIKLTSDAAKVNSSTLEAVSSGLFGILSPIFGEAKQAQIECALLQFDIQDGIAKSEEHVIKLGEVFIFADGHLDLSQNKLQYSFNVNSENPTLASLIPPFKAYGSIGDPSFAPTISGTIASVVDTTQGVVDSASDLAVGAARFVVGSKSDKLSAKALCKKAYEKEQSLLTSRLGSLFEGDNGSKAMHPSWDLNQDGINDCENEGSCDDMIDYSKPRPQQPTPLIPGDGEKESASQTPDLELDSSQ